MSPAPSTTSATVRLHGHVLSISIHAHALPELGILVWQDFQFACGVYPAHEEFDKSVCAEAEANVTRMRRHPSIAVWCGNNEDYQQIVQWSVEKKELPAKLFYEDRLPKIVARLNDDDVPYWPGSPFGGEGWDTSDPTVGDTHQWNVSGAISHVLSEAKEHLNRSGVVLESWVSMVP